MLHWWEEERAGQGEEQSRGRIQDKPTASRSATNEWSMAARVVSEGCSIGWDGKVGKGTQGGRLKHCMDLRPKRDRSLSISGHSSGSKSSVGETHSLTHSLTHPLTHSLTHLLPHSLTHSLTHTHTDQPIQMHTTHETSTTHRLTNSFTYHPLIRPATLCLTHPLTH